MKRPIIPTEFGAKIPTNIRQRYLNTFIDECVKFCPSEDVAFQTVRNPARREACVELSSVTLFSLFQALDEEKLVYERSSSKNIYLNVAVNTLKKLRSKSNSCSSPGTSTSLQLCYIERLQQNTILYQQSCKFDYCILFYAPKDSSVT